MSARQALEKQFDHSYEQLYFQAKKDYLTLQEDYLNLEKRTLQEQRRFEQKAAVKVSKIFLEALNNLLLFAEKSQDKGLQGVIGQIFKSLQEVGVTYQDPKGKEFNEQTMEAVATRGEGRTVVETIFPEFWLNGELLQPAKVIVGSSN